MKINKTPFKFKSRELEQFIRLAQERTLKVLGYFRDTYDYNDRLLKMENSWIPMIKMLRKQFLLRYVNMPNFRDEFVKYLEETSDYLAFCNLLISAPDQRKFDNKGEYIPFTIYPHQMVIWEVSRRYSIAMPKSRDMGASFLFNSGYAMNMLLADAFEVLFLSRIEDDVDRKGDFHQTNMGRVRQLIKSTKIFNYDSFEKDVKLFFQRDKKVLIKGSSSNPEAGRQGRYQEIWLDEAGANPKLKDIKQALSFAGKRIHYTGTLKPGTDEAFRQIIASAEPLDWKEVYDSFLSNFEDIKDYRLAWNKTIESIDIPESKVVNFHIKYDAHPLKTGHSNYYEIESNRLYNDPVIIAHELNADLNAGSPDRSLYNAKEEHFIDTKDMEDLLESGFFDNMELMAGFDPGGKGKAALIPIFIDNSGNCYVMPKEIFDKGNSPKAWMNEIIEKYPKRFNKPMTIISDQAINQYKEIGWLWNSFIYNGYFQQYLTVIPVSNHNFDSLLLIVNAALSKRVNNPLFSHKVPKILIDESNRDWVMTSIYGMKYSTDKRQKELSHPFEAFVYWCANEFVNDFENFNIKMG